MAPSRLRRSLAAFAGGVIGGYWLLFSSYSQLITRFPYHARTPEKVIALTFDDGPNEPFTTEIADFLADVGVHATFFQVGRCVARHPEVSARLVRDGHVIGNHSYSHQMHNCVGRHRQERETRSTQRLIASATGRTPALYRPPWLLRTPTLPGVLRRHRLTAVSGEFCHAFEVLQPSPQRIARRALAKARPGAILIFHDGFDGRGGDRAHTVAAVKIVVPKLLGAGFRFVTVDALLGFPAYAQAPA